MHSLHEEVDRLAEAKNGADWSSADFCAELKKRLGSKIKDRPLRCSSKGLGEHSIVTIKLARYHHRARGGGRGG